MDKTIKKEKSKNSYLSSDSLLHKAMAKLRTTKVNKLRTYRELK